MNPYYTHRQFLELELNNLGKKDCLILELGVGHGSSFLINEHCKNNLNHKVLAFETDKAWFNQMKLQYGLNNYIFNHIENWGDFESIFTHEKYDLVFVDQSPWQARIDSINFLKDKTNVFILHDYDYFNKCETCNNIFVNDETSWLYKNYCNDFILEDNYKDLPPTLVMRKKTYK